MGTFHDDKGELHGITVVVDTHGATVYVGRCDQVLPEGVLLLGADRHEAEADADASASKAAFVQKAASWGFHPRIDRVLVPTAEVATVTRLGDVAS